MKKKVTEQSDEELLKSEKTLKVLTSMLAGMLLVLFIALFISMRTKGFSVLSVVPVALLPIVVVNVKSLKEIERN